MNTANDFGLLMLAVGLLICAIRLFADRFLPTHAVEEAREECADLEGLVLHNGDIE